MNKKLLSLVLAFAIVLGSFGSVVFAAEDNKPAVEPSTSKIEELKSTSQKAKIQALVDRKLLLGRTTEDGKTDLALDANIQRAEVTKFIVEAIGQKSLSDTLHGLVAPFVDVPVSHWANGLISAASTAQVNANARPIVIGNENGEFLPEKDVTYAELATMLVRIVVADLDESKMSWPNSYLVEAQRYGIFAGIDTTKEFDAMKPATRANALEMIYNALALIQNKQVYEFGEHVGVISKLTEKEVTFNQDSKLTYKLTPNTKVSRGSTWYSLGRNYEYASVGSLVRYIVNGNGEVTHIIELGNQRDGVFSKGRFNGLFAKDNNGYVFEAGNYNNNNEGDRFVPASYANLDSYNSYDLVLYNASNNKIVLDSKNTDITLPSNIRVNGNTKIFAVDRQNNEVREFNSINEVINYKKLNNGGNGYRVYGAFEKVQNRYEANYLVFSENYNAKADVRRVVSNLNNAFFFDAEDVNGKVENFDLRNTPIYPTNRSLVKYDVVDARSNELWAIDEKAEYKLIDAANDNVYKVASYKNEKITLQDKDGVRKDFTVDRDVKEFLRGEVKKDVNVQIHIDSKSGKVDVISVVPFALKGELKYGYRDTEEGKVLRAAYNGNRLELTLAEVRDSDGVIKSTRNVIVTVEDTQTLQKLYPEFADATKLVDVVLEYEIQEFNDNHVAVIRNVKPVKYVSPVVVKTLKDAYDDYLKNPTADNRLAVSAAIAKAAPADRGTIVDDVRTLDNLLNAYDNAIADLKDNKTIANANAARQALVDLANAKVGEDFINDKNEELYNLWITVPSIGSYTDVTPVK